jgi:hypothetical protein
VVLKILDNFRGRARLRKMKIGRAETSERQVIRKCSAR